MYELQKAVSKSICKINHELRKFSIGDNRSTISYAVFVRNLSFLGNNNSVVKMSSMLMPVVAITLIRKSRKLPKSSHSRKTI